MRLFLILALALSTHVLADDPPPSPPRTDAHNKGNTVENQTPEEAAKAQENLTKALDAAGVKDLFQDKERLDKDVAQLRELSQEQKDALKKAFEGTDANTLPESSKAINEQLKIMALSDDDLSKELEKPASEKDPDKASPFNREKLVAEMKDRLKNSMTKPSEEGLRAVQKLQSDERTKAAAEKLKNYSKLPETEQDKIRDDIAKVAIRDKEVSKAYWDFFESSNQDKTEAATKKATEAVMFGAPLKGYERLYNGKFSSIDVFQDSSGRKFSVSDKDQYQEYLGKYKTMSAKDRLASEQELLAKGLTYYEKKGDVVSEFELKGARGGNFAFTKDLTSDKTFAADPSIKDKLHLKDTPTTQANYDVRVWRANADGKGSSVTSHQMQLFDTNIEYQGNKGDKFQLGYTGGKYFMFTSEEAGSYSNPHRLITEPENRYNYNFSTSESVYLRRESDGANFKLSTDGKDPANNTFKSVQFSTPAPQQTYYFYNGNYYYQPVGYGTSYYGNGGYYYYGATFYPGCST